MNTSIATFMKLALVSIVVVALLWNKLAPLMADMADDVAEYVDKTN
ncbi:hypothetical protein [Bacillus sp. RO1]|nr:hypothetical protein [Bacillus sp. RO1]NLP52203.1 hypothetical protein [Bacillus sp. RO1]